MGKTIITAALTGAIHVPSLSPYLPITPEEMGVEAEKAWRAGAAIVHVHARNPADGRPASDMEIFRQIATEIRKRCPVVIGFTTGGAMTMTPEERVAVVSTLKPELASLNSGSINFVIYPMAEKISSFKFDWEESYLESTVDLIFANTYKTIGIFAKTMYDNGTVPELEVYDVGHINTIRFFVERGILRTPIYIQFVMGIQGGIPATVSNLVFLYETARRQLGDDFRWSVCAAGRAQLPLCNCALLLGGNVRVGLEDSLFVTRGKLAESSAEQVEKIRAIAETLGLEIASSDEARGILGLKGNSLVSF